MTLKCIKLGLMVLGLILFIPWSYQGLTVKWKKEKFLAGWIRSIYIRVARPKNYNSSHQKTFYLAQMNRGLEKKFLKILLLRPLKFILVKPVQNRFYFQKFKNFSEALEARHNILIRLVKYWKKCFNHAHFFILVVFSIEETKSVGIF